MTLLAICPTWQHPERLETLIESFLDTRTFADLLVYVNDDDPQLEAYKRVLTQALYNANVGYRVEVHRHYGPALNHIVNHLDINGNMGKSIRYYQEINDDHIYHTKGWDEKLVEAIETKGQGWGIACGDEGVTTKHGPQYWHLHRHPSGAVVSANIIRTLGYFVPPYMELDHIDTYLRDIGDCIDRLFYVPEVKTQHNTIITRPADKAMYNKWVREDKERDEAKLKDAIRNAINDMPNMETARQTKEPNRKLC